jgi:hypothetical protein
MTHRAARHASPPPDRGPGLSAIAWRRLRRAVTVGILGLATTAAVGIGWQGATTSPVASANPTAAGNVSAQVAEPVATPAPARVALVTPRREPGHRRR